MGGPREDDDRDYWVEHPDEAEDDTGRPFLDGET